MKSDSCEEIRIVGPPGCGKTTTLSGLVATAVRDYGSEAVLVSSFTRAAARELISRDLPVPDDRIGTLHALCYRALDRPKILTGSLLKDWNAEHPTKAFGGYSNDLDDPWSESSGLKEGDLLLQEYNRRRGLQTHEEGWPLTLQAFAKDWHDFKANTGTVDFTDLIATCLREQIEIPHAARVFFLDEVQDFSPLELALARQWGRQCDRLYLVGDEDQCLYSFKGCRPDAFLSPPLPVTQYRMLGQSYRVPRAVHRAAVTWIEQVHTRLPKAYQPRPSDGLVDTVSMTYQYPDAIASQLEAWLATGKTIAFLASCSFHLDPLKHKLREWGLPFHNPYRRKRGDWNPLTARAGTISAADRVLAFRQVHDRQQWWTYARLWAWAATIEADGIYAHGAKTQMRRQAEAEDTADLPVATADLDRWFIDPQAAMAAGAGDLDWLQRYVLRTYEKPMAYACRVLQRRGSPALTSPPQIILGTIHSVKGGEADIVVLFPDLSPAAYNEWIQPGEPRNSVIRTYYVGMTRAKDALYWAQPSGMSIGGYL